MIKGFPKKISKLLSLLITFSCIGSGVYAEELPRLLLCFYVEGMQLELAQSYSVAFTSKGKGLEKLLKQGILYPKVEWDILAPNRATALATIASGTFPSTHGIGLGVDLPTLLEDVSSRGIYTADRFSASALQFVSFSDLLSEASQGESLIYSIAPFAEDAITIGGKQASVAFWIDERSKQWCSNSHYPQAASLLYEWKKKKASLLTPPSLEQKEITWAPSSDYQKALLPYYKGKSAGTFLHTLKGYSKSYLYKRSALVNEGVTTLATSLLDKIKENSNGEPSVLHVVLSCRVSNEDGYFSPYSPETIDAYARVDQAIATLVEKAETTLGADHVALSLVSLPVSDGLISKGATRGGTTPSKIKLYDRIKALVNLYLSALYGKENWVKNVEEPFLYLDQALIEKKGYNRSEVQQRTATLMKEMKEVKRAYPLEVSSLLSTTPFHEQLLHTLPPSSSADIFFTSQENTPHSTNSRETTKKQFTPNGVATHGFMVLCHPKLEGKVVCKPVHIASWSTSWAYIFRIRPPIDAHHFPLDEVFFVPFDRSL